MRRHLLLALAALLAATPAAAIEPEMREVVVTHNRVWDGYAYKENFVPSAVDEMFLMANAANAVNFVRTQEYYWPLSRQTYVAFEKQYDDVPGMLVIRDAAGTVIEIERQPFSILYPQGAVHGQGELLWGEDAEAGYAAFREEERAFVRALTSSRQANTAYEAALREAASARLRGEGVQEVPPPPERPEPFLKLVTEPQPAFRVDLPAGRYDAVLVENGEEVAGTRKILEVIDVDGSEVAVLDIVPEERWTRPIQSNRAEERIYVRPGARFFVTVHDANRYAESDYVKVVSPQGAAPHDREIWVRRKPSAADALRVDWTGAGGADVPRTELKVVQTQGSNFGYVVREAAPDEISDLSGFPVDVPDGGANEGRLSVVGAGDPLPREIVVVQPRRAEIVWPLALVPALAGLAIAWRNWSRRRGSG
jgi:hypothetical protein